MFGPRVIPAKKWLGTLLLSTCSLTQIFLISDSKTKENGGHTYPYNYAVMPFLAELMKLVATVIWTVLNGKQSELLKNNSWQKWRIYAVLAFIYMLINNIIFLALQYGLTPISYIAVCNIKTVTTAIFFFLCLGRGLTHLQWHAMGMLTVGATMTQIGRCSQFLASPVVGISWSLLSCGLSASAGVFTEMFLKREEEDLFSQNFKVYACGCLVNFARLFINHMLLPANERFWWFEGFDRNTWVIPINLAVTGILVSWVMRSCPISLKIISNSTTLIASYFVQQAVDEDKTNAHIFLGIIMICISLVLYYTNPKLLSDSDSDRADLRFWCGIITPSMTRASTHPSLLAADSTKTKSYMDA